MSSSSSDEGPYDFSAFIFKILVVGEQGCGKTSFIRAFYDNNSPTDSYSFNGAKVYPCKIEFQNMLRDVTLLEFLGDSQITPEERKMHLVGADAIVLMYAVDDPSSFQAIVDKWLKEIAETVKRGYLILVLVGNKIDLRNDQKVIERLSQNNQTPLTPETVCDKFEDSNMKEYLVFLECSSNHVQSVLRTTRKIIQEIYNKVKELEKDIANRV